MCTNFHKTPWSKTEDEALVQAVEHFGGKNWKGIAEYVPGRSDVQCLERWRTIISPKTHNLWTFEEDQKLSELVTLHGTKWSLIANHLPGRIAKQCRERWTKHLNPDIKNGDWEPWEDDLVIKLYNEMGSKWSKIAQQLPGRTDNAIKNRFNSTISRKIRQNQTNTDTNNNIRPNKDSAISFEEEGALGSNDKEEQEASYDEPGVSETDDKLGDKRDTELISLKSRVNELEKLVRPLLMNLKNSETQLDSLPDVKIEEVKDELHKEIRDIQSKFTLQLQEVKNELQQHPCVFVSNWISLNNKDDGSVTISRSIHGFSNILTTIVMVESPENPGFIHPVLGGVNDSSGLCGTNVICNKNTGDVSFVCSRNTNLTQSSFSPSIRGDLAQISVQFLIWGTR